MCLKPDASSLQLVSVAIIVLVAVTTIKYLYLELQATYEFLIGNERRCGISFSSLGSTICAFGGKFCAVKRGSTMRVWLLKPLTSERVYASRAPERH